MNQQELESAAREAGLPNDVAVHVEGTDVTFVWAENGKAMELSFSIPADRLKQSRDLVVKCVGLVNRRRDGQRNAA